MSQCVLIPFAAVRFSYCLQSWRCIWSSYLHCASSSELSPTLLSLTALIHSFVVTCLDCCCALYAGWAIGVLWVISQGLIKIWSFSAMRTIKVWYVYLSVKHRSPLSAFFSAISKYDVDKVSFCCRSFQGPTCY